jgi:hypothetical protein
LQAAFQAYQQQVVNQPNDASGGLRENAADNTRKLCGDVHGPSKDTIRIGSDDQAARNSSRPATFIRVAGLLSRPDQFAHLWHLLFRPLVAEIGE